MELLPYRNQGLVASRKNLFTGFQKVDWHTKCQKFPSYGIYVTSEAFLS